MIIPYTNDEWPYPDERNDAAMQEWWNETQALWRAQSQIDLVTKDERVVVWLEGDDYLLDGVMTPKWARAGRT